MRSACLALALAAGAGITAAPPASAAQSAAADTRVVFPASVQQGAMVIGRVPPGSRVTHAGRTLRVTGYGSVVFGVARDQAGPVEVRVQRPDGRVETVAVRVDARDWPVERVGGLPPKTVSPPKAVAERIAREQARVAEARTRDEARAGFAEHFTWPVEGRISGRFGNHRVYNGTPGAPHSGMDIAAATGTPVRAPASGIVSFADDLYLTGGTVVLDHGHGVSSNFLHLSRMDVEPGTEVRQGEVIGAVGATGRATGPHLHWGMNWFDVRIDPLLVLERR
ncbi:M23 family metallopeptidase [Lysobacter sp. GX 14042]|uniref:M23 family metallopeptidase n=1 Tax=Lysobacter sp. GX 14042 TaxID=2907155 RepID=UPI001F3823A2|nr:M23 family metallopeptidase [Lysobacter sp. GX 14042]